jgi:hypothetical protein
MKIPALIRDLNQVVGDTYGTLQAAQRKTALDRMTGIRG